MEAMQNIEEDKVLLGRCKGDIERNIYRRGVIVLEGVGRSIGKLVGCTAHGWDAKMWDKH